MLGGAGHQTVGEECASGAGGEYSDLCCTGASPGYDRAYYLREAPACGASRACYFIVGLNDYCQDSYDPTPFELTCCADGRWHLVDGDSQYVTYDDQEIFRGQLSPACGGTARHSSHALHFDGNGVLEIPLASSVAGFAVELWFRSEEPTGSLLASTTSLHRLYLSEGKLCFAPALEADELCTSQSSFADGAWHHAAFSAGSQYDERLDVDVPFGGLYADGTLSVAGSLRPPGPISGLRAGFGPLADADQSSHFVGDLDEIRVWASARDPFEVLDYHATRLDDPETLQSLVGYFALEDSGSTAAVSNLGRGPAPARECGWHLIESGAGAPGDAPDATLVDFDFTTSPWVEPGAF
jgi:hypothetical protein